MLTTIFALAGGIGAALIGAWATLRARRPRKSMVELVDVSLPPPGPAAYGRQDESPVLDVKVRNTGGQPAVLKRLVVHVRRAVRCGSMFTSMRLMPYDAFLVGATLPVSETYDLPLAAPEEAAGERVTIDLSQVVEPGKADRFQVRLGLEPTFDTVAYLLDLEVRYDGNDRRLKLPLVAVAFPKHDFVYTVEEIRDQIHEFQADVDEVRRAIDRELAALGLAIPDWNTAPPRHRDDLPGGLLSVDGIGDMFLSGRDGVYEVNDSFWDPRRTIARHLHAFETQYRELVEIITPATVVHDFLRAERPRAEATLGQLPALHDEFGTSAGSPIPSGVPDAVEQPARLLADLSGLEELRTRVDAGDEGAIRFLDQLLAHGDLLKQLLGLHRRSPHIVRLVELLEDRLKARGGDPSTLAARRDLNNMRGQLDPAGAAEALTEVVAAQRDLLGPDHDDVRRTRQEVAAWRMQADDAAGAAAALADVVEDLRREKGPDDPSTLVARHNLAFWRGKGGDIAGAIEAFADLLEDMRRVLGADDPRTLDARHELARWRGEAGDAATAFAAFTELVPDRIRVHGPDHQRTLISRHNLARWQGEAGDAAGAATAFAELLDHQRRVLGPRHPDTLKSEQALAYWQEQAGGVG